MANDWGGPPMPAERAAIEEMRAIGRSPTARGVERLLELSRHPPSVRMTTLAIDALRLIIVRGRTGDSAVREALGVAIAELRERKDLASDPDASAMRDLLLSATPLLAAAARQTTPKDLEDPQSLGSYMSAIDDRMRNDGVEIGLRPLEALRLISEERRIEISLRGKLGSAVVAWFDRRYGNRLKMDFSLGRMLVTIRGDPYVARFPLVYGTATVDLRRVIEDITDDTLRSLPTAELNATIALVRRAFEAFISLSELPRELIADWDSAVAQVVARHPQFGLSKWSSHQALEKVLNRFITIKGGDPKDAMKAARKRGLDLHDLNPLVEEAERRGLLRLDRAQLACMKCTANVRYAERAEAQAVTVTQAVEANQASVFLCASIATQM